MSSKFTYDEQAYDDHPLQDVLFFLVLEAAFCLCLFYHNDINSRRDSGL